MEQTTTLYIHNLTDRLSRKGMSCWQMMKLIIELSECLYGLFSQHGQILDVVIKGTAKMRGQAFVVFKDASSASAAMHSLQGYPFFGRSLKIEFAKTVSRAIQEIS